MVRDYSSPAIKKTGLEIAFCLLVLISHGILDRAASLQAKESEQQLYLA